MQRITNVITGRKTSWIVLAGALLAAGAIFGLGFGNDSETLPGVGLPESAESARVATLQEQLPAAEASRST